MASSPSKITRFLAELKRRGVIRAAAVYATAAWVIVEVSATVLPALHLPDWTVTAVVIVALVGLPLAVILSWAFDLTTEGLRRTEPVEAGAIPPRRELSRARGLVAVALVAVLAATGGYLAGRRITGVGRTADDRLGLAVFPFRATGGAVEDLSEGVADLLATVLDGTHGIRIADPWSLWRSLRPERASPALSPDPEEANRLALQAGARHFLLGSVVSAGDSLGLNVRVYDVGNIEPLYSFAHTGDPARLSDVVQRLAVEVITRLWSRGNAPHVPDLDRYATRSADALKAYLDAKAAMRRGMVDSASAAIDRAIALDSTFALALVEATAIKSWQMFMRGEFYMGLMELAERAVAHSDSLSERNRLRAEAALASIRTDGATAGRAARRILEIDSTDFAAWDSRAYYDMVYGWQYGADESDMLEAAERVVQLDSTYVPGLFRRAWLAVAIEDPDDMRLQMSRLRFVDTTNVLVSGALLGLKAILASDSAFPGVVERIAAATPRESITTLRYLRNLQPDRADLLLERLRQTAEPGGPQWKAAAARLYLAEGRMVAVDEAARAGEYQVGEFYKHLYRFQTAAALSGVGEPEVADRAVDWLAEYVTPDSALAYWDTRPVWWTAWLVAAYHASFGDTTITRRWHETIETFPEGGTPLDYRGGLQADLEARLAVRRGELAPALEKARQAFQLWSIHTENDWEALAEPQMRFHLAMLYRANDQTDSAAAVLRSLVPPTTWMGFLTARASYELGELAENRGDLAEAARHYRRAFRYWQHGGPEIAPWRERAEAGLRRTVAAERAG